MTLAQMLLLALVVILLLLVGAFLLRDTRFRIFGPVLYYDMIRVARRGRYFLMRMLYAGVLIALLFFAWATTEIFETRAAFRQDSRLAEQFFGQFMLVQLFAISILTPAYVGGSIAEEKERKTLEFMLATDLSNHEIVLSKYLSRLANLVLFVLIGLPILSFLQFLGGIDPNMLLAGFLATIATAVGTGGFSILCSVLLKRPRDGVFFSFMGFVAYVGVGCLAVLLQISGWSFVTYRPEWGDWVPTLSEAIDVGNTGNIVLGWFKVMRGATGSANFEAVLWGVVWKYSLFHTVIAVICLTLAVWRLRPVSLRQTYGTPLKPGLRHVDRPPVGDLPILWKSIHVEQGRYRLGWIVTGLLYLLIVGGGLTAVIVGHVYNLSSEGFTHGINIAISVIGGALAFILILGIAVRASTAISGEKERDTWDALMATPLDSDSILWQKLLGTMIGPAPIMVLMILMWVFGMFFGGMHIVDFVVLTFALFLFTSAFAVMGLWFSIASQSSARATMWIILINLGVTCCCTLLSPVQIFFQLPMMSYLFRHEQRGDWFGIAMMAAMGLGNLLVYFVGTILIWKYAVKPRFRRDTLRNERSPRRGPPDLQASLS